MTTVVENNSFPGLNPNHFFWGGVPLSSGSFFFQEVLVYQQKISNNVGLEREINLTDTGMFPY